MRKSLRENFRANEGKERLAFNLPSAAESQDGIAGLKSSFHSEKNISGRGNLEIKSIEREG